MAQPILIAKGLTKHFGERVAVDHIDLSVLRGECFGFLGPNGAGKTTTIQMILGRVSKTAGELSVFGLPVPEKLRQIKSMVGVVPQRDNLDSDLTVEENLITYASYLNVPRRTAIKRGRKLLDFFALSDRRHEVLDHLSGGQRRRLLLARALIHEPTLLILDEPTVGLDPQARYLIWEKLNDLKDEGITVLLTSHYMDEVARLSDRVLIMDAGKVITQGVPQKLVEDLVGIDVFEMSGSASSLNELQEAASHCHARIERTTDTLFLYTKKDCPELDDLVRSCDRWLRRPANLEDLFIQITGRSLHEAKNNQNTKKAS